MNNAISTKWIVIASIFLVVAVIAGFSSQIATRTDISTSITGLAISQDSISIGCKDSDFGIDYFRAGNVTTSLDGIDYCVYPDICTNTVMLKEYYCSNGIVNSTNYVCNNGCSNGRCNTNSSQCIDTCSSLGYDCGSNVVCGSNVDCGSCPSGQTCTLGKCQIGPGICSSGQKCYNSTAYGFQSSNCIWSGITKCSGSCSNGLCSNVPPICTGTCSSKGFVCGTQNICDVNTNCGTCQSGQTCTSGKCIINPPVCKGGCSAYGFNCGNQNICGSITNCGTCSSGQSCSSGKCIVSQTCTCTAYGFGCGTQNICGVNTNCGSCQSGQSCSSGTCQNNLCSSGQKCYNSTAYGIQSSNCIWNGITNCLGSCSNGHCVNAPPVCTDTCSSSGFTCGTQNICGSNVNCGTCASGQICNSGQCTANQTCSCSAYGFGCGTQNICNHQVACGTCPSGQSCSAGTCVINPPVCTGTCSAYGFNCGSQNICGSNVNCGSCQSGQTCTSGKCVNTPPVCKGGCSAYGFDCGSQNICGSTVNCGSCQSGQSCSSGKCIVILPPCTDTCSSSGFTCGTQTICGTTVNCGTCSSGQTCTSGKCVNNPPVCTGTCSAYGFNCGSQNICGSNVNCGSCQSGQTCTSGKCVNTPPVCKGGCSAYGFNCGNQNICGVNTDCGSCPSGQSCSAGVCQTDICTAGQKCYDDSNSGYQSSNCIWSGITPCADICSNGKCLITNPTCTGTCKTKGYKCGVQNICGVNTDCGSCAQGYICTEATCAIIPSYEVTVATFGYGKVVSSIPGIDCRGTCSANFSSAMYLTAVPDSGYKFTGWDGDCTGMGPCNFLFKPMYVSPSFVKNTTGPTSDNGTVIYPPAFIKYLPPTQALDKSNCKLISGSRALDNWNFVIVSDGLVDGDSSTNNSYTRANIERMVHFGYGDPYSGSWDHSYWWNRTGTDSKGTFVNAYRDRINFWYVQVPSGSLSCNPAPPAPGSPVNTIDCNIDAAKSWAVSSCGSYDQVLMLPWSLTQYRHDSDISDTDGTTIAILQAIVWPISWPLFFLEGNDPLEIKSTGAVISSNPDVMWHELGHSFGGNYDYYMIDSIQACMASGETDTNCCAKYGYDSKMCDMPADFKTANDAASSQAVDAYMMANQFNKKCTATVNTQGRTWQVFSPTKGNLAIPYWITVQPNNIGNPSYCQLTLVIYDILGQWVKVYTTTTPPDGINYMALTNPGAANLPPVPYDYFLWDETNIQGQKVATGTYFARVCSGDPPGKCIVYKFQI